MLGRLHLHRAPGEQALITDDGPSLHTRMPEIRGQDTAGRPVSTAGYPGRSLALLLLSPGCAPCERLLRDLNATRRGLFDPPQFLVVIEAPPQEAETHRRRYRLPPPVVNDEQGAIREELGVKRTPYGFLIDAAGIVRMKGVVNDREQLEGLIRRRGRPAGGMEWKWMTPERAQAPARPGAAGAAPQQ